MLGLRGCLRIVIQLLLGYRLESWAISRLRGVRGLCIELELGQLHGVYLLSHGRCVSHLWCVRVRWVCLHVWLAVLVC